MSENEVEGLQASHGKRNRDSSSGDPENNVSPIEPGKTKKNDDQQTQEEGVDNKEKAATTTLLTNKDFGMLIKRKHKSVSWMGNYSKAHDTKIEIGFLKKEAKALVTLMCYYQVDGEGATSCPVAMISGTASFGRKLAIFYSRSCITQRPHYPVAGPVALFGGAPGNHPGDHYTREKVPLGAAFKLDQQSLETLAKLGRANFYLGTLEVHLEKALKKKKVLDVTEHGRLDLSNEQKVLSVLGEVFKEDLDSFVREVFISGQLDIADLLIRHIQFSSEELGYLCRVAINTSNLALTQFLFDKEPDSTRSRSRSLLTCALVTESLAMVKIVMKDADVNVPNLNFPLHTAILGKNNFQSRPRGFGFAKHCGSGPSDVVQFLLENGAQVNVLNNHQESPMFLAVMSEREDLVRLLASQWKPEEGPDSPANLQRMLVSAVDNESVAIVEMLVRNGVDVKDPTSRCLHHALEKENLPIVKLLVKAGADVTQCDISPMVRGHPNNNNSNLPLHTAIQGKQHGSGPLDVVQFLLDSGAPVHAKVLNQAGQSPMALAILTRREDLVRLLASHWNAEEGPLDLIEQARDFSRFGGGRTSVELVGWLRSVGLAPQPAPPPPPPNFGFGTKTNFGFPIATSNPFAPRVKATAPPPPPPPPPAISSPARSRSKRNRGNSSSGDEDGDPDQ